MRSLIQVWTFPLVPSNPLLESLQLMHCRASFYQKLHIQLRCCLQVQVKVLKGRGQWRWYQCWKLVGRLLHQVQCWHPEKSVCLSWLSWLGHLRGGLVDGGSRGSLIGGRNRVVVIYLVQRKHVIFLVLVVRGISKKGLKELFFHKVIYFRRSTLPIRGFPVLWEVWLMGRGLERRGF